MTAASGPRPAPLRVLVVDDEPLARRNLTLLLRADPDVGEVAECGSGLDAIAEIRRAPPDLLFLDVQMPECGGFDVLEMLGGDMPRAVVFATAYDEYALRAFEAGALDYLLKPFDDARFHRALARAKERLAHTPPLQSRALTRIAVKSRGQTLFVNTADIDWIEAADYCALLHVGGAEHIVRRSLQDLERDLDAKAFARIHRSTIVNLARVRGLELQDGGDYEVALTSGARLRLSRRYRKGVAERLGA
jgi:two-component system LytT family response regulator